MKNCKRKISSGTFYRSQEAIENKLYKNLLNILL